MQIKICAYRSMQIKICTYRSIRLEVFCKKKVFLEISQNSQENTCALLKKRLWYRCFPVNFVKFLGTPFLHNTSGGCFCAYHK